MNFRLLLFALLLSFFQFSHAGNNIAINTAGQIAKNVYFERSYTENPVQFDEISFSDTRIIKVDNEATVYIFNIENGGFVIVPADDALPPYLGYDLQGSCPAEGINKNFDSFLSSYAEQITYIRERNLEPENEIIEAWNFWSTENPNTVIRETDSRGVAPLLINLWNQDSPYNMLCPEDPMGPGGHVYAGCVATAMSMVMHYWRYPLQGEGSSGYYPDGYPYQYANYGETEYNYSHMQTEMDGDMPEVALLQYHCGVAVEMMYGANGSGAYSWHVPGAIKNHFRYASAATFKQKDDYPGGTTAWAELLKEQINLGQPMYYSGFSNSGGHAFVCDGYDDDNLFHFNFGWSGSSNGYYTLYQVGGFNSGQGAVINFIPGEDYPYYYTGQQVITGKSGSIEDGSGPVENYINDNQVSWLISPQSPEDSISSITLTFKRFEIAMDDEVIVYDGATESSAVLGTFTGTEIPPALSSTGNELLVVLQSNGDETANGFLAEYTSVSPVWCSGMTMLVEPTGEISDGSMEFNYDNNANCKWMINPANPTPTTLYFTAFNTEAVNDKLLIYDLDGMEMLAQISGDYSQGNLPDPVTSESGKFFIVFVSNSAITGSGWDAYYAPDFVGIEDNVGMQHDLSLYPNPASGSVNIFLPQMAEDEAQLTIFNLSGAKVYERGITENISLNTEYFLPGIYIVILRSGDNFYRKELIVQ